MSELTLTEFLLLLPHLLFAGLWLAVARLGAARLPALHLAAAAGATAAWALGLPLLAGLLAVLLLRRGLLTFATIAPRDGAAVAWVLLANVVLLAASATSVAPVWAALVGSAMLAVPLWLAGTELAARLRFEFGTAGARAIAWPLQVGALLLLLRGVGAPGLSAVGFEVVGPLVLLLLQFVAASAWILRLVYQWQYVSDHDVLTALLNRRGFEDLLSRECERLRRYAQPFAVLSIDVDHLRSVNERFGHECGDEVLVSVARVIGAGLRDVDRAARVDGQAFSVLLPHTETEAAQAVAERLRQAVREQCVGPAPRPWTATVSIGVAAASDPQEPASVLLQRLDRALHRAKQDGRDRVQLAESRAGTPRWQPQSP